jgi:hypothetical protein
VLGEALGGLDFGAAVIYKDGFHPLNHFLYRVAQRFDYNAWIKHKYMGRLQAVSPQDRQYYRRTWIERAASRLKRLWLRFHSN